MLAMLIGYLLALLSALLDEQEVKSAQVRIVPPAPVAGVGLASAR